MRYLVHHLVHGALGPAKKVQALQHLAALGACLQPAQRPWEDGRVARRRYLAEGRLVQPACIQLGVVQDVVQGAAESARIGLLSRGRWGQQASLAQQPRNPLQLGRQKGPRTHKRHTPPGGHPLCVPAHLHTEGQAQHAQEGLHRQAVGIVRQQDLLYLVRLKQLRVFWPWLST